MGDPIGEDISPRKVLCRTDGRYTRGWSGWSSAPKLAGACDSSTILGYWRTSPFICPASWPPFQMNNLLN